MFPLYRHGQCARRRCSLRAVRRAHWSWLCIKDPLYAHTHLHLHQCTLLLLLPPHPPPDLCWEKNKTPTPTVSSKVTEKRDLVFSPVQLFPCYICPSLTARLWGEGLRAGRRTLSPGGPRPPPCSCPAGRKVSPGAEFRARRPPGRSVRASRKPARPRARVSGPWRRGAGRAPRDGREGPRPKLARPLLWQRAAVHGTIESDRIEQLNNDQAL